MFINGGKKQSPLWKYMSHAYTRNDMKGFHSHHMLKKKYNYLSNWLLLIPV